MHFSEAACRGTRAARMTEEPQTLPLLQQSAKVCNMLRVNVPPVALRLDQIDIAAPLQRAIYPPSPVYRALRCTR
jgi:hypothetical protein